MAIQPLRGFRDFYPEDQARIEYLRSKIAQVCDLFGYEQFEGPALEPFELYAAKSSDEIVNDQAFVFEDRGGEKVALRPELTPTLARMIASRQNQLTFPLRWWSFGRFWRYERPQKGRAREFYQWNCDLFGDDSITADVEILEIIIAFLQSLSLTADQCIIEINDRSFMTQLLSSKGFTDIALKSAFAYLDRLPKLQSDEAATFGQKLGLSVDQTAELQDLYQNGSSLWQSSERMAAIMRFMDEKKLSQWIQPSLSVVRGFDYYTNLVFELSDRSKQYRAMLGGGRYSNLVQAVGGTPMSGIGFGMGDIVLSLFLADQNLLTEYKPNTRICIANLSEAAIPFSRTITEQCRAAGCSTVWYGTADSPNKALKFANKKNIPYVVLVGENEIVAQKLTLKNLQTGTQELLTLNELIVQLNSLKNDS